MLVEMQRSGFELLRHVKSSGSGKKKLTSLRGWLMMENIVLLEGTVRIPCL